MSDLHVIFKLAGSEYALASDEVIQMDSYTSSVPVPGAPDYIAGLVHVRSQVVPALDLRRRFGFASEAPTAQSRIIVLKKQERLVALLVDSAREVQVLTKAQFQTPPDLTSRQASGFVKAVVQINQRIIMVLDSEKLVGEESLHG